MGDAADGGGVAVPCDVCVVDVVAVGSLAWVLAGGIDHGDVPEGDEEGDERDDTPCNQRCLHALRTWEAARADLKVLIRLALIACALRVTGTAAKPGRSSPA